jgi:hypothetical protein
MHVSNFDKANLMCYDKLCSEQNVGVLCVHHVLLWLLHIRHTTTVCMLHMSPWLDMRVLSKAPQGATHHGHTPDTLAASIASGTSNSPGVDCGVVDEPAILQNYL